MEKKVSAHIIKGMQRDLSVSKFNPEFAFENKNLRLLTQEEGSMFSLTNEKGTKKYSITYDLNNLSENKRSAFNNLSGALYGIPIGTAVVDDKIIVFCCKASNDTKDAIISLYFDNDVLKGKVLKYEDLNFDTSHPIETLVNYENSNIQKVYWVDGKNQPRMLNICTSYTDNAKVDFICTFSPDATLYVEKEYNNVGLFSTGTIQYFLSYYNKFGQETNIAAYSDLLYISPKDRGGAPDEVITCSFNIEVSDVDKSFDYARIYALYKNSSETSAYIIEDVDLKELGSNTSFRISDSGIRNESIDPTILLYLGGKEIIAETIEQKDNTLFLGNLTLSGDGFTSEQITGIKNYFASKRTAGVSLIDFSYIEDNTVGASPRKAKIANGNEIYPYINQLQYPSKNIKTFKGGEWYRFGIQFCNTKGQWSQVFWVEDKQNPCYPKYVTNISSGSTEIYQSIPIASFNLSSVMALSESFRTIINNSIYKDGSIRLCMVPLTGADRTVIAQGIVSPTVFNLGQRKSNQPFVQSSWFMRPDHSSEYKNTHYCNIQDGELSASSEISGYTEESYLNKSVSELGNGRFYPVSAKLTLKITTDSSLLYLQDSTLKVTLSNNSTINATLAPISSKGMSSWELWNKIVYALLNASCTVGTVIYEKLINKTLISTYFSKESFYEKFPKSANTINKEEDFIFATVNYSETSTDYDLNYFVDRSYLTFHSPELEEIQDRITENIKFRLVGRASITANKSDYEISATETYKYLTEGAETLKVEISHNNKTINPTGLKTLPIWKDTGWSYSNSKWNKTAACLYPIYPWHHSGSICGGEGDSSILKTKKFANLRYCITEYLTSNNASYSFSLPIEDAQVFNSDGITINKCKDSYESEISVYEGNYDYMLAFAKTSGTAYSSYPTNIPTYENLYSFTSESLSDDKTRTVRIKYKSTPHIIVHLGSVNNVVEGTATTMQTILPYSEDSGYVPVQGKSIYTFPWRLKANQPWFIYNALSKNASGYSSSIQTSISALKDAVSNSNQIIGLDSYFWIGELYVDKTDAWLGGTSDTALKNLTWEPISSMYEISKYSTSSKRIVGYGDTYYQRWDCLKTYPFTEEDENSIIDITSFMVESHINIDGRYDTHRGPSELLYTRPTNSNLINKSYTPTSGIFTYSYLDSKYDLNKYSSQITWTKTKTPTEDIDSWTNITVASTLELDGDKGNLVKLKKLNNRLLAFQEDGVSEIQFNNLEAISTTSGVPLEISNSNKVNGKQYLTTYAGCDNKWSITEGVLGLYFIDGRRRKLYRLGSGLDNLSDTLGFNGWSQSNIFHSVGAWSPVNNGAFKSLYSRKTSDIFFINKDVCLAYNENFGQFISFYSYEDTPFIESIEDKTLMLHSSRNNSNVYYAWSQNEGDYNYYFDSFSPFYTTIISNQNPTTDKVFDTLEFRSDTYNSLDSLIPSTTFNKLEAWNEYQYGKLTLNNIVGTPSNLKQKFRIWRATLPRTGKYNMDRMRNPWLYVKLAMDRENNYKTILHDMMIYYFE